MYQITVTLHTTLTVFNSSPYMSAADTRMSDVSVVRVPFDHSPVRTVVLTVPRRWFGVFDQTGMGWLVWRYIPPRRLMMQEVIEHEVYETLATASPAQNQALRITITALPQSYPIRVAQDVAVHVISDYPETHVITRVSVFTSSLALDAVKRQFPTTYWSWSMIASDAHERIAAMLAHEGLNTER